MPELPEVETIKRDIEKEALGSKILRVDLLWPGTLKDASKEELKEKVFGKRIIKVERRAKILVIGLENGTNLVMHMKMTGHLLVVPESAQIDKSGSWVKKTKGLSDPLNQYIRAVFYLDNGKKIAFSDLRKFGYIKIVSADELKKVYMDYGPEPFSDEFTKEFLEELFGKQNGPIKKVLMDQTKIAGIGNIYADEILWLAKVHPLRKASDLSKEEIGEIYEATKKILTEAIERRGTSVSDFRDTKGEKGSYGNELAVYRKTGQPCPRDGTPIERITVGGRGTHFCPTEQRMERS